MKETEAFPSTSYFILPCPSHRNGVNVNVSSVINRSASCHCKRDFCRCLQPRIKRLCQSFKLYCCSISSPSGTINLTQYKSLQHQDQSPTSCGNDTQKLLKYNSGYLNQLLLIMWFKFLLAFFTLKERLLYTGRYASSHIADHISIEADVKLSAGTWKGN